MEVRSHSRRGGKGTRANVAQLPRASAFETTVYRALATVLSPIEHLCVRGGLRPDVVTVASLATAVFAGVAASSAHFGWAGLLYLISGAFDLLDGRIARVTGTVSPRGAALDFIADRVSELFMLGGLAWGLHTPLGASLCFALLSASMVVSYARARGEGLGVSVGHGLMARGPRVALLAVALSAQGLLSSFSGEPGARVAPAFLWALGIMTVLTTWTAVTRVTKVLRALPGPHAGQPTAQPPHIRPVA